MSVPALGLISFAFGFAALKNAWSYWNWSLCAVGVAAALYFLLTLQSETRPIGRVYTVLLLIFSGVALLQLLPLPIALVSVVSPARIELLHATEAVLAGSVQFVTLSAIPSQTSGHAVGLFACILVFFVARDLSTRFAERSLYWTTVWPLLIVATFEAALGCVQAFIPGGEGLARGTYPSRDHYAGLLELVVPFALLYPAAIMQRTNAHYGSWAASAFKACSVLAVAAAILTAIIYSLSRMGFLAMLAGLFVAGSLVLSRNRNATAAGPLANRRKYLPVVSVAGIVFLGLIYLPTDALIARFSDLTKAEGLNADTRALIWRESLSLARDFPVFGCGLGGFESCFLRYKTAAPMGTVSYAHNDYLQILAEMGVLAFGAGLLLAFGILRTAVRNAIHAASADERYLSVACAAALVAILLHSTVDFNLYRPANATAVAWIAGIAMSVRPSKR